MVTNLKAGKCSLIGINTVIISVFKHIDLYANNAICMTLLIAFC